MPLSVVFILSFLAGYLSQLANSGAALSYDSAEALAAGRDALAARQMRGLPR